MALLKCEDCGREVSSKAAACPHCGCPVPQERAEDTSSQPSPSPQSTLPPAWRAAPQPSAPKPTEAPSAGLITAVKWVVGALLVIIVIKACSGEEQSDTTKASVEPAAVLPAPAPPKPMYSDTDRLLWAKQMDNATASPASRQKAAQDLIAHFGASVEGKRASALLAELDKAVAYEQAGQQWTYDTDQEGMSDGKVRTAWVVSTNTINLDFPYGGPQHGRLIFRRHPRWGNDVIFRIEQGQILCHSYGDCTIQVRFDDGQVRRYEGNPPEDNTSEVVFIPAFGTFMKQLPNAKVVKIEVSIYQAGNHVFEFDVSGFKPEKFQ